MHDDGCVDTVVLTHTPKLRQSGTLPPNFAITGYATERIELLTSTQLSTYTPSFDLRHPLPNFAITGYATEAAPLLISAQLSTIAVSALRKQLQQRQRSC